LNPKSTKEAIAVVVGRLNSRGLPKKNTRVFLGKPLVEWSIRQAIEAKLVSKVIVTSDDPQVLEIARGLGVEVVVRPLEMAGDSSPVGEALLHAIDSVIPNVDLDSTVLLVEPTSPLRPKGFIDEGLQSFWSSDADSAVSVGKSVSQHPFFSLKFSDRGLLLKHDGSELRYVRRQDIPDVYFLDGSFYATTVASLRRSGQMYSGDILGIPVKKWQEIEIDDVDDFVMAESLGVWHLDEL
jgi:CMP-N,N'-diacetyllegionaminic acid synthase